MRRHLMLTATALVALTALAAPVPKPKLPKARSPITVENAKRLRPVEELTKSVSSIIRGPKRGEMAFVNWEKSIEVVDEVNFRVDRKIAARHRPIAFATSKDGQRVAWCENNTRVQLQEVAGGKTITIETGNDQPSTAFSPDGKLLATGGYGTRAKLWDMTGKPVRSLDAGGEGGLTVVFSPDGKTLAVGNRNDETSLFEVATGKRLYVLPRSMTQELAFSPDGKVLAAGYVNGSVALWDVKTGKVVESQATGAAEVYTLDWGLKGDVLVTAGLAGKIVLWDLRLTKIKELEAPGWVIQARFTPDGNRLLTSGAAEGTGTRDRKVVVWGVPEGDKR